MTVTLTYDATLSRVQIDANGLGSASYVLVERSIDETRWTTVRGGTQVTVTAGSMAPVDDYEFAPDVLNYYRVTPFDAGLMTDTFTRSTSNGWGTATSGQTWSHPNSTVSNFSTNGTKGLVSVGTVTTYRRCEPSPSPTMTDFNLKFTVATNRVATGDWTVGGVSFRHLNDLNRYFARWEQRHVPASRMFMVLYRQSGGTVTELDAVNFGSYSINEVFGVRVAAQGSNLKFKLWRNSGGEPNDWNIEVTDTDHVLGETLIMSAVGANSTVTLPVTYTYDDLTLTYPPQVSGSTQTGTITPVLSGVWLKSLGRPFLNRQVYCAPNPREVRRSSRNLVTPVVGRSLPHGTSAVRGSRELTVNLVTPTVDERIALNIIIGTGDPLFFHTPMTHPLPTMYVVVRDSEEERPLLERRCQNEDWRNFVLPLREVAAPGAGVVGSTGTWQTVIDEYDDWQELVDNKDTWLLLLEVVGDVNEVIVP
jgi:hypothetical protein